MHVVRFTSTGRGQLRLNLFIVQIFDTEFFEEVVIVVLLCADMWASGQSAGCVTGYT